MFTSFPCLSRLCVFGRSLNTDVEKALEEIAEKEAVVEETAQNDKKKLDSAKAAEMRTLAQVILQQTKQ